MRTLETCSQNSRCLWSHVSGLLNPPRQIEITCKFSADDLCHILFQKQNGQYTFSNIRCCNSWHPVSSQYRLTAPVLPSFGDVTPQKVPAIISLSATKRAHLILFQLGCSSNYKASYLAPVISNLRFVAADRHLSNFTEISSCYTSSLRIYTLNPNT